MSTAKGFLYKHRIEFAVLGVFFAMIAAFAIANPRVFLNYRAYFAVFTTLGASIVLVTANVFVVASGEMDLSFPSIIGLSAMVFAVIARAGANPWIGLAAALKLSDHFDDSDRQQDHRREAHQGGGDPQRGELDGDQRQPHAQERPEHRADARRDRRPPVAERSDRLPPTLVRARDGPRRHGRGLASLPTHVPHFRRSAAVKAAEIVQQIESTGVVAIIRTKDPARVFDIVGALARGGVKTLEITMTVPGAIEVIRSVATSLPEGIMLGAGTAAAIIIVRRGSKRSSLPLVFTLEALLLAGFVALMLYSWPITDPDAWLGAIAGLLSAAAMGVQSALVRLLLRGVPQTPRGTGADLQPAQGIGATHAAARVHAQADAALGGREEDEWG